MLGDKRFIQTIRLRNLLSFGPESEEIELKSLNVLIGPNASGKSNFIEALSVLRNTPNDIAKPIREGGGINEWLWKGSKEIPIAEINIKTKYFPGSELFLRHTIRFTQVGSRFELMYESLENEMPLEPKVIFKNDPKQGRPAFQDIIHNTGKLVPVKSDEAYNLHRSVLSQRKDPTQYQEIFYLGDTYEEIKLYSDWGLGKDSAPRKPQAAYLIGDFLEDGTTGEVANNLALVVSDLQSRSDCWDPILERFKNFHPNTEKITPRVIGNTVLLMLHEKGCKETIPATRWSDGMLRYLALLTILCHPEPPPLICIEEPELGMHPDILSDIAELLIEASHRTQLIVTTHSDILVSALTEVPESVLVCERDERGTSMRRLQKEKLEEWLKKYSLGELWRIGELGGNRW